MPDYRLRLRPPAYTRLLGRERRERYFEPAYFEMLEERLPQLEAAGSAWSRRRVRARFQWDALRLALDCLRLPSPREDRSWRPALPFSWQELRFAARGLRRSPGFACLVVATLALGIGANTAIFSVVNAVLLRSLPYREPERVILVWASELRENNDHSYFSFPAVEDYRGQARSFESLVAFSPRWSLTLRGRGEPERISGYFASAGMFEMLGVAPVLGRTPTSQEDRPGVQPVALLSYGFWQRGFGGDPAVIGSTFILDDAPATAIGVLPPSFRWLEEADVWLPLSQNQFAARGRPMRLLTLAGRLRTDVTPEQAAGETSAIASRLGAQYPDTDGGLGAQLAPLREELLGRVRRPLQALFGAVALVLLIACANVANLFLARATAQRRALAIRAALGAGRARLMREPLVESTLLALLGGGLGAALAVWGVRAMAPLVPLTVPRREDIAVDGSVLLFTLGASLLTGLLLGLFPAFEATRGDLNPALKDAARGAGPAERHRLRSAIVVGEIALALIVLVASALLVRSFARLQSVDPGIEVSNVVSMDLSSLPADAAQRSATMEEIYRRLAALPGVVAAGDVTRLPLAGIGGNPSADFVVEGREAVPGEHPQLDFRRASRDYFRALGVPVLSGRMFAESDRAGSPGPLVALINQAAAERFFPGESPVGRRARLASTDWYTIVGVVGNVRHLGLHTKPRPEAYVHTLQAPPSNPQLAVRTAADPTGSVAGIRRTIRDVDPNVVMARVATMQDVRDASLATPRFNTLLFGAFAFLALALGVVGIYGVMACTVAQRIPEMGIRVALGASGADLLRLVVGHALRLAAVGAMTGVAVALGVTRVLQSLLFEVSPTDPAVFVGVVALLLVVTLVATGLPALRAARVDPLTALREE